MMKSNLKLMLAAGWMCLCIPTVAGAVTADCNTVSSCKENIINELDKHVSNTEADYFVEKYTYDERRAGNEFDEKGIEVRRGINLELKTVDDSMARIEADYEKLLSLREQYKREMEKACENTNGYIASCLDAADMYNAAAAAVTEVEKKGEELLYSKGEGGYVWITSDEDKLIRLQGVINRTIEKNEKLVEQKEEIDNVIKNLGKARSGASFTMYPTVSANVQSKVCTDSILKAADESAKKAANVYGEMLLPAKYPKSEEDIALMDELLANIYRSELAYSLAISTFNLNRIGNETDKKIAKLKEEAVEMADSEAGAVSFNSNVIATMGSEIIPLIVNIATTTTLEAIDGVKYLPRKNVNIE